jgi:hypothetical protein
MTTQLEAATVKDSPAGTHKWVYDFDEGSRKLRDLLGGEGAGVAEMTRILGANMAIRRRVHRRGDVEAATSNRVASQREQDRRGSPRARRLRAGRPQLIAEPVRGLTAPERPASATSYAGSLGRAALAWRTGESVTKCASGSPRESIESSSWLELNVTEPA